MDEGRRGADARPVRLPAAPALSLPRIAEGIPARFSKPASVGADTLLADLLEALYRERVVQPRHWHPGKELLQVATDGLQEWAHRRGRLGTHPLRHLNFIELHIAADIQRIGDQSKEDWYEDPRAQGWYCIGEECPDYAPAALALDICGPVCPARALKHWTEVLQASFGEEVAESFVGVLNTAIEELEGWGPAYAYQRAHEWDDSDEDDEERFLLKFEREIPAIARTYAYRRAHLLRLASEPGPVGMLGEALVALARVLPIPWRRRKDYQDRWYWLSNHAGCFGGFPAPVASLSWSNDPLPDGGFDAVMCLFDDEYNMLQNSESVPFYWLYPFDPKRAGDGPGTLRLALEVLERELRLVRIMDGVLTLLDGPPAEWGEARVRV